MKRWLIRPLQILLALLFAALLVIQVALPYIISKQLQLFLQQNGAQNISLDLVEADLLSGRLALHNLQFINAEKHPVSIRFASINLSWSALLQKQIRFSRINLYQSSIPLKLVDSQFSIAGITLPSQQGEADTTASTWTLLLQYIDGRDNQFHLDLGKQQYDITLHRLSLRQPAAELAEVIISLQNRDATLRSQGKLQWLEGFKLELQSELNQFSLENYHDLMFLPADLKLGGLVGGTVKTTMEAGKLQLQSELATENLYLLLSSGLLVQVGATDWQGDFTLDEQQQWQLLGGLNLSNANIIDNQRQFRYLRADQMVVQQLSLKGTDIISTSGIMAENIDVLGKANMSGRKQHLLSADKLQLGNNSLQSLNQLKVEQANVQGATVRITLNQQGQMEELSPLSTSKPEENSKPEKEVETNDGFSYFIGRLEMNDDSRLQILDKSITPEFKLSATPFKLQLTNLDSQNKLQSSLTLNTTLNRFSKLQTKGQLYPLDLAKKSDLKLTLKSFELPSVSGYSAKYAGFNIKRGLLSSDSKIKIKQNKLNIENRISIDNFALENLHEQQNQDEEKAQVGMPLNQALELLRDKDGDITFNLPIRGDLNQPDISLADITEQAVKGATQSAALIYLQQALQPWGSIYALAKFTFGQMSTTRLQPVEFTPNGNQLNKEMQDYLNKLVELLTQKKQLRMEICGVSTKQDTSVILKEDSKLKVEQLNQLLLSLADQRAQLIKQYLVEQGGLQSNRLFICQPRIEDTDEKPRVDLGV